MLRKKICVTLLVCVLAAVSCTNQPSSEAEAIQSEGRDEERSTKITEEAVEYRDGQTTLKGFITYDANDSSRRPAVLVVPEWWGVNDYVRGRARQLAELGYVAMTIDMYGDGKIAADPKEAMAFAGPFYNNPQALKTRFDAAYNTLKEYSKSDSSRIGAIGFCFGGYVALNAAKLGADLKSVVIFHGGLSGVTPDKNLLKAKLLVLNGGADSMVSKMEIAQFKKSMDSIGAAYTFKSFEGAQHAFTNPQATEIGKKFNLDVSYNAAADSASWIDMKQFLADNLK